MLIRNASRFIAVLPLMLASMVYGAANESTNTPSQAKSDIKVNIQGDKHHNYQGEVRSSGSATDDSLSAADRQIQADVLDLIKNNYRGYNLNIKVFQGTVALSGSVENEDAKRNIESAVLKIQGVKKVDNALEVNKKK